MPTKRPPKLGQHFLKDARALSRIVSLLDIGPADTVVEIGPGHGELSRRILKERPARLIAIEKDAGLAGGIRNQELGMRIEIIEGDALKELPKLLTTHYSLFTKGYKLTGNIPYYITGHLFGVIGGLQEKPSLIVLTVQKEVALRLAAEPPKMNLLAASVQFWGKPEIVRYVSKKSFRPAPKVDSAIIKITPLPDNPAGARRGAGTTQPSSKETKNYYRILKILFAHPRKTIANNLASGLNATKEEVVETLTALGLDPHLRPQDLDSTTINKLARKF